METESELQISLASSLPHTTYAVLLSRFTECHEIDIGITSSVYLSEQLRLALIAVLSQNTHLRKIDCEWDTFPPAPDTAPVAHNEPTSLRLWASNYVNNMFLSDITFSIQLSILIDLHLRTHQFTMDEFASILTSTTNFQTIRIPSVCITGAEETHLMVWASSSLRQISLGLYLDGHQPDLDALFDDRRVQFSDDERDRVLYRTTDIANALTPSFIEQIDSSSSCENSSCPAITVCMQHYPRAWNCL